MQWKGQVTTDYNYWCIPDLITQWKGQDTADQISLWAKSHVNDIEGFNISNHKCPLEASKIFSRQEAEKNRIAWRIRIFAVRDIP